MAEAERNGTAFRPSHVAGVSAMQMLDHPAFRPFTFREAGLEGPYNVNCLGARARSHYFPESWFAVTDKLQANEEALEWIDILDAVSSGGELVTIVDLGAGYGRWLVNAALAAGQLGKRYRLGGVECEPTHFDWMLEHLADNGISSAEYRAWKAAVSDERRDVFFTQGHSGEWYGQSILETEDTGFGAWPATVVNPIQTVPAADILAAFDVIDGLHVDLQGEEARVLPSIMHLADTRVRRVHVGTHSREIDKIVEALFLTHGWSRRFTAPFAAKNFPTPFGSVDFNDGVQSWSNPRLEA